MITKTFEIRDITTFIPILAIKLVPGCERDRYLLDRAGYGETAERQAQYVQLCQINAGHGLSHYNPDTWRSRTLVHAHRYIKDHFDDLESGAVIDVEYILGERNVKKKSEQFIANN